MTRDYLAKLRALAEAALKYTTDSFAAQAYVDAAHPAVILSMLDLIEKAAKSSVKQFRIMGQRSIPFAAVAPYEDRAKQNHDQSLDRLNERGGLDVSELWAIVHGKTLREVRQAERTGSGVDFAAWFTSWIAEYEQNEMRTDLSRIRRLAEEACELLSEAEEGEAEVRGAAARHWAARIREELSK